MDNVGKTKNGASWFFVNQSGGISKLILFYVARISLRLLIGSESLILKACSPQVLSM